MHFLVLAAQHSEGGWLQPIVDWVVNLMNLIGAPGVGIGIALENLFPPIPSEVLLPLAGFTASQPGALFTPLEAIIWATAGSVIGALALYWIGAVIGHNRTVAIFEKLPLVSGNDVEKTVAWFNRHGYKAVFFGRMVPLFRSLISIPAGIERMHLMKFTLLTLLGSLLWNTIWILAGFWLGNQWETVIIWVDRFKYLVIAVLVVLFIIWLVQKFRARRA